MDAKLAPYNLTVESKGIFVLTECPYTLFLLYLSKPLKQVFTVRLEYPNDK